MQALCPNLKAIWMLGNAPQNTGSDFSSIEGLKIYVEAGTTGWPGEGGTSAWDKYTIVRPHKAIDDPIVVETTTGTTNITDYTVKYDGKVHQPKLEVINPVGGIVRYSLNENGPYVFTAPSFKNACATSVWYVVSCKECFPITNKFSVCISQRNINLASKSKTKPYDGTPLSGSADDIIVSGDGYADGESFEYYDFASEIGPTSEEGVESTFRYRSTSTTDVLNYKVSVSYGRLSVLKVSPLVITPSSGVFEDAGQEISISCATDNVIILYTLDGTEPSLFNGYRYKGPFYIYQTQTIQAKAIKEGWTDSDCSVSELTKENELGNAINLYGHLAECATDSPWSIVTDVTHDGKDSVRSAKIGENETTYFQVTVRGAGVLSFWWKTTCEESIGEEYYDYALFKVGGAEATRLAGRSNWTLFTTNIQTTGKHVLRWEYTKDGADYVPPDCVWVDQVQWVPADGTGKTLSTPVQVPYSWFVEHSIGANSDYETVANSIAPNGHRTWECYVAGENPKDKDSRFHLNIDMSYGYPGISWEPDLNSGAGREGIRTYRILGSNDLVRWAEVSDEQLGDFHFFKAVVEMPK